MSAADKKTEQTPEQTALVEGLQAAAKKKDWGTCKDLIDKNQNYFPDIKIGGTNLLQYCAKNDCWEVLEYTLKFDRDKVIGILHKADVDKV